MTLKPAAFRMAVHPIPPALPLAQSAHRLDGIGVTPLGVVFLLTQALLFLNVLLGGNGLLGTTCVNQCQPVTINNLLNLLMATVATAGRSVLRKFAPTICALMT